MAALLAACLAAALPRTGAQFTWTEVTDQDALQQGEVLPSACRPSAKTLGASSYNIATAKPWKQEKLQATASRRGCLQLLQEYVWPSLLSCGAWPAAAIMLHDSNRYRVLAEGAAA